MADKPQPLTISYSERHDALTINGVRYNASLFREIGDAKIEPGALFRLAKHGDLLTVERVQESGSSLHTATRTEPETLE